jgi:branched-chain amino acid transport system permease protein
MDYFLHLSVIALLYGVAALGLDFFAGRTGALVACQAAFMGVGAYTCSLLLVRGGQDWLPATIAGVVVCAVLGPLVGIVALRARADYFVIATLALQIAFVNVVNGADRLTGGPLGIRGIPHPLVLGTRLGTPGTFLLLLVPVALACVVGVLLLERSAFLPCVRAGRDDSQLLATEGKNWNPIRLTSFGFGAGLGGLAGALLAQYIGFIDAATFSVEESILVLSMVLLGGLDRVWGAFLGALVLTAIPELLRMVLPGTSSVFFLRTGLYGFALILVVLTRPRGILGRYSLTSTRYE